MTSEEAIKRLVEGNARYMSGMPRQGVSAEWRASLSKEQHPYAVVIGCSDSRVPVEIIFDAMPGDLFVIRTAGNVVGPLDMASVEFAISAFKPPLVVVLGHEHCGAVYTALKGGNIDEFSPSIKELLQEVLASAAGDPSDDTKENYEHENYENKNIRNTMSKLMSNPYIAKDVSEKTVYIAAAKYSLDTGKVTFFE